MRHEPRGPVGKMLWTEDMPVQRPWGRGCKSRKAAGVAGLDPQAGDKVRAARSNEAPAIIWVSGGWFGQQAGPPWGCWEGRSGRGAGGLGVRGKTGRRPSGRRPVGRAAGAVQVAAPDVGGRPGEGGALSGPHTCPHTSHHAAFCFTPIPSGRGVRYSCWSNAGHVRPETLKGPQQGSITTFQGRHGNALEKSGVSCQQPPRVTVVCD